MLAPLRSLLTTAVLLASTAFAHGSDFAQGVQDFVDFCQEVHTQPEGARLEYIQSKSYSLVPPPFTPLRDWVRAVDGYRGGSAVEQARYWDLLKRVYSGADPVNKRYLLTDPGQARQLLAIPRENQGSERELQNGWHCTRFAYGWQDALALRNALDGLAQDMNDFEALRSSNAGMAFEQRDFAHRTGASKDHVGLTSYRDAQEPQRFEATHVVTVVFFPPARVN